MNLPAMLAMMDRIADADLERLAEDAERHGTICSYTHFRPFDVPVDYPADWLAVNIDGEWLGVCNGDLPSWWGTDWSYADAPVYVATRWYVAIPHSRAQPCPICKNHPDDPRHKEHN